MTNYQALIKDRIFIGGIADVADVLEKEQVDIMFDLRVERGTEELPSISVHMPISDDPVEHDASIKRAADAVKEAYDAGKKIYFHCSGGRGRTGTVAIGTLLALGEASTFEEAEQKAKEARPILNPPEKFVEALKRLYPNVEKGEK